MMHTQLRTLNTTGNITFRRAPIFFRHTACIDMPSCLTEPLLSKGHHPCCRFTEGAAKAKEVAADASKQDAGPGQASAAGSNGTKETLKKTS